MLESKRQIPHIPVDPELAAPLDHKLIEALEQSLLDLVEALVNLRFRDMELFRNCMS